MPADLATVLTSPPSGRSRALLLDHHAYAGTVLLRGRPLPWADPAAFSSAYGQAQSLLRPDVAFLDLGRCYQALLAADPTLLQAMSARSRTGFALRTLLGHAPTTQQAIRLAQVIARSSPSPLVVQIPSPLGWLASTHVLAQAGPVSDLDADDAERAAMYVADWVRGLAELPLVALLLDERDDPDVGTVPPDAYSALTNIVEHYRWALGRRGPTQVTLTGGAVAGAVIPSDFWSTTGAPAPDDGGFLMAEIPPQAVPETVLAQLKTLD